MSSRFFSLVVAGLCGLASALPINSEAFFASVKAMGMGGCGVAYPQDTLCAAYNPAGMVYQGDRGDVGVYWRQSSPLCVVTESSTTNANGTFHGTRGKEFGTPDFGLNYMVFDSVDVSLGVVAYTREWLKSSYAETFPDFGTSRLLFEYYCGTVAPVAAIRFERFAFGVSCDFIIQRVKAMGLENFDNSTDSQHPGAVSNRKEDFNWGIAVTMGATYRITNCFTAGFTWQLRSTPYTRIKDYRGLIADDGKLSTPTRLVGGIYWKPCGCAGLAVDIEYLGWNKVNWWRHRFPSSQATLTTYQFGTSKGPGFGWDDQIIARVGADIKCGCLTLRVGYHYSTELIPKDHTFFNTLGTNCVAQVGTVGLTMDMGCGQDLSLYYGYGVQRTLRGRPIGSDWGNGVYTISNQTQEAGVSIGYCW